jgi:heme o synthase
LSLNRAGYYTRAGIPSLPALSGEAETQRQILIYTLLLVPISFLPWLFGFASALYEGVAVASGAMMVVLALQLRSGGEARRKAANRLFAFSISYLVLLFAALLIEKMCVA